MGGAVCAKILLCNPPIAANATTMADFAGAYLRGEMPGVELNHDALEKCIEATERAEHEMAEAMAYMVKALGGY